MYPAQISRFTMYQRFSTFPCTRFKPFAMLIIPLDEDQRAVTAVTEIMVAGDFNDRSLITRKATDL